MFSWVRYLATSWNLLARMVEGDNADTVNDPVW